MWRLLRSIHGIKFAGPPRPCKPLLGVGLGVGCLKARKRLKSPAMRSELNALGSPAQTWPTALSQAAGGAGAEGVRGRSHAAGASAVARRSVASLEPFLKIS